MQAIQEEQFDISTIPSEFSPFHTLDQTNKPNQGDEKLFVQFKVEPVLNPSASTKAGRPIFDEVDMIVIRTPGSQLTSVVAPAKHYMSRFGDRYKKWKAGQIDTQSGTPLESFPYLLNRPGMVAELKALNVHTVEQLAGMSDGNKQRIMGGQELCRRASEWIDKTQGTDAKVAGLAKENDDLKAQMLALQEQMKQIASRTKKE
jgi:hypothetical protein